MNSRIPLSGFFVFFSLTALVKETVSYVGSRAEHRVVTRSILTDKNEMLRKTKVLKRSLIAERSKGHHGNDESEEEEHEQEAGQERRAKDRQQQCCQKERSQEGQGEEPVSSCARRLHRQPRS